MDIVQYCVLYFRNRADYSSEGDTSSDDEWDMVINERGKRQLRPRILDYNNLVQRYQDHEFKSHFRLVFINVFFSN